MQPKISRRSFIAIVSSAAALSAMGLSACGKKQEQGTIRIGTMPTEHLLPLWVAEQEGLFKEAGIQAEIIVFDSAQNLSAAITAGEVDIAMTDPMRAVKLVESGTPLSIEWATMGAEAGQGRFGVMTSADSGIHSLVDLVGAEKGVGVAANTVPEYVFEKLCEINGIDPASIVTEEVPSLPDRYSLMAAGQLDAAALPESMLALGEATGMVLLADNEEGQVLSPSIMVVRDAYKKDDAQTLLAVRKIWDKAVHEIEAHPEQYRALLIEKANLNAKVADTYPISAYPLANTVDGAPVYPAFDLIDPQIEWMKAKGYSTKNVAYHETDGTLTLS